MPGKVPIASARPRGQSRCVDQTRAGSAIWAWRLVAGLMFAVTSVAAVAAYNADPCDQAWGTFRAVLLISPLILFGSLVALGMASREHRREPWLGFAGAFLITILYLPLAIAVFFWDTGC